MTNSEKVKLMSGSRDDKMSLFNWFMDKVTSGEGLDESEIPMLEFLKKDLLVVGEMSANMQGTGGLQ